MEATTVCAHCGEKCVGRPLACPGCGEDPRVQGRYRIEGELGRGGSGVTWRARREPGGEPVCLKELRWASMGSLDDERRFAREGKLLEALQHPAIPKHYGAFAWGEGRAQALFIAQELVVGDNLEVERRARGYTSSQVLEAGVELGLVLAYLHERHPPVVHRDLKPSNVMRRADGQLVLIDFGAARTGGLAGASEQLSVAGTFGFMAPEQIRGEAGPPADVYGLGMTLAVLLAGGPPEALLDGANRPDFKRIAGLRSGLARLLEAMCAVDPATRPTAAEVVTACRELLAGAARAPVPSVAPAAAPASGRTELRAPSAARVVVIASAVIMIGGIAAMTTSIVSDFGSPNAHVSPVSTSVAERVVAPPIDPPVAARAPPVADPPVVPVVPIDAVAAAGDGCARGQGSACEALLSELQRDRERVLALPGWPAPLVQGCEHGVGEACYRLALVHSQGLGVSASRIETKKAFAAACELGQMAGCAAHGNMLLKGDGGPSDWKAALNPLERACSAGDDDACLSVGAIHAEGKHGAKLDRPKALSVFEGLCAKGLRPACENVDAMVGNDWGLPASGAARIEALTHLCAARSGAACVRLGDAYARGSGVKKDAARAREVYALGCDVGLRSACEKMR